MSGLPPATPLSASSLTFVHENPIPRALQHTPGIQTAPVYPAANPQPSPIQPKAFYTTSKTSEATRRTAPFTGKELFELIQAAIAVRFFEAKHGEKGHKVKEMGSLLRAQGIPGSDNIFKTRMLEMLAWHEDPETAPEHIIKAVEGSSYEGALGAPLDLLLSSKKKFEDLSDEKVEKLRKKADEDKRGGEAIRNASLRCSRRRAQADSDSDSDDDAHALPTSTIPAGDTTTSDAVPTVTDTPSDSLATPASMGSSTPAHSRTASVEIIEDVDSPEIQRSRYRAHSPFLPPDTDFSPEELEEAAVIQKKLEKAIPVKRLIVKSESSATKKKHSNADVNDGQPSTRNTKRVKRADSNINLHDFLLEEREKREEFQGLMLSQMEKGNSQFERSLENTQNFQNNFLAILARAFDKGEQA